ncbi:hypothetical protein AVHM3334_05645 [Acidovorax sp. SUPP3334]|nr:hypothetical protein AVHM3334_05645 [Acidovorax sp. SUPP3334]
MMKIIRAGALMAAFCLFSACGDASKGQLQMPEKLDPALNAVVSEAWPKVKKACVGLDRYAKGLKVVGVQNNNTIDVLVSVPDSGSGVPDRYMSSGQTCYLSIARDGRSLTVAKEGCKALCLDRSIAADEALSRSDFNTRL